MNVTLTASPDAVLEVTGVAATEILRRCEAVRAGRTGSADGVPRTSLVADETGMRWRLVDFADCSDDDFVRTAHLVLLGRRPSDAEAARRMAELRNGSSRLDVLVRLALSPEGRVARHADVSGVGLPLLFAIGRGAERAAQVPALDRAVRWIERAGRQAMTPHAGARRNTNRLIGVALLGGAAIAVARRRGRLPHR